MERRREHASIIFHQLLLGITGGWEDPWKTTERSWSELSVRSVSLSAQWGEAQTGKPNMSCYGNTKGASPSLTPICVSLEDKQLWWDTRW